MVITAPTTVATCCRRNRQKHVARVLLKRNPISGRAYHEVYVSPYTGLLTHPWPEKGAAAWLCCACLAEVRKA